jgi:hypothetical protein
MESPGGVGPAVFADMGITSSRKSTIKGHDQDVKVLNEFLGLKNMKLFSLDANSKGTISERDLCKVSMMGELATFLKEVKKNDVYRFKPGSAKNRFGGIKNQIERRFGQGCFNKNDRTRTEKKGNRFDENGPDGWFKELKRKLDKDVFHRCFMDGSMAVEKGVPCYREESALMNKWLLKVISIILPKHKKKVHIHTQKNKGKDYAMRAAKNLTWNACGRAGEIAKADCKEHLSFDRYFRKLRMDWTQVKTGKLKVVFFTAHATSYVVCAVNSLVCHLAVNGHTVTKANFLFPELCDNGQPSQRMTKLWKDFYEDEENVFSQYAPEGMTAGVSLD